MDDKVLRAIGHKNVLLTGVTGFVGKAFLEKLLRCVPQVGKVFLLIRNKPTTDSFAIISSKERFEHVLSSPIFDDLKTKFASSKSSFDEFVASKVVVLSGELGQPDCGLSVDDKSYLTSFGVDIVVHCAASIKFTNTLADAVKSNTISTLNLYQMASQYWKCSCFVHLSTAFVSLYLPNKSNVEEEVPKLCFDASRVLADVKERNTTDAITLESSPFPNTYVLTKAMTEVLLKEECSDMPTAIVRPSIIGAAWKEPIPGWIDNKSGVTGAMIGIGTGVLKMLPGDSKYVAAIVPVDICVNHIFLAIADILERKVAFRVSHCCTSTQNPVRWSQLLRTFVESFTNKTPIKKLVSGRIGFRMIKNKKEFNFKMIMKYSAPSAALNFISKVVRSKTLIKQGKQFAKLKNILYRTTSLFETMTSREYLYKTGAMTDWDDSGREHPFSVSVTKLNWTEYFYAYSEGIKRYVLKEYRCR